MQKVLIGILAVATVALAIVCTMQSRQLRVAKEQVRAVEAAQVAAAEAQQYQAERIKELERTRDQLDRQVQQFTQVTTMLRTNEAQRSSDLAAMADRMRALQQRGGRSGGGPGGGAFGEGMGKVLGEMMKNPGMREMMYEQQKAAVNMMFRGLFQELNLTPEETEKLKQLLTDRQMKNVEFAPALMGDNQELSTADAKKAIADANAQTDAQIKEMLGEERFAAYNDYQKNIGERMQLDQFKAKLAGENLALEDQQTAQLWQIMKEEKAAQPPAIPTDQTQMPDKEMMTSENLDRQLKWMEDYNRRLVERAAQVLSPEQLQQYQQFQEQQMSMQKLGLNMARQMFGGEKPAPPTAPVPQN